MGTTGQTPAERKAAATAELTDAVIKYAGAACDRRGIAEAVETLERKRDAYARACIAEAVAPALEYIDACLVNPYATGLERQGMQHLRRLLTEGRE